MTSWDQASGFKDGTGNPLPRAPDVIRPGTSAVIFDESGAVLLEQRSDNGFWGLPGGAVDVGESVAQAVMREVLEETGLQVRITRLVGIYSDPRYHTIANYPSGDIVHYVTVAFQCERLSGRLRMSEESTDLRYFDVDALPDNTMSGHRFRITDALANSVEPFIR